MAKKIRAIVSEPVNSELIQQLKALFRTEFPKAPEQVAEEIFTEEHCRTARRVDFFTVHRIALNHLRHNQTSYHTRLNSGEDYDYSKMVTNHVAAEILAGWR